MEKREFHSIELASWLHTERLQFVLRQKQSTTFRQKFQPLNSILVYPGIQQFYTNINLTQKPGFGRFNLAVYWKRRYRGKQENESWHLLTNLPDLKPAVHIYSQRFGIEAMFRDCKSGGTALGGFADLKQVPCGYNLEGSKASPDRLVRLDFINCYIFNFCMVARAKNCSTKTTTLCLPHSRKR